MKFLFVASIALTLGCGRAASPADSIALGRDHACTASETWDGLECVAPHVETSSAGEKRADDDARKPKTETVAECDDCDEDDSLDDDGTLFRQAIDRYRAHDPQGARKLLFDLISKHPQSAHVGDAYYWFGKMFEDEVRAGDPSKWGFARSSFEEATHYPKAPLAPSALLELAHTYEATNEPAKAKATYARLRQLYPQSPAAGQIPVGH